MNPPKSKFSRFRLPIFFPTALLTKKTTTAKSSFLGIIFKKQVGGEIRRLSFFTAQSAQFRRDRPPGRSVLRQRRTMCVKLLVKARSEVKFAHFAEDKTSLKKPTECSVGFFAYSTLHIDGVFSSLICIKASLSMESVCV